MPSITSWMRLEPRSRDAEMKDSLQARIYDPLWLLARQWQLGEFQGEDNGSPIMARWRGEAAPITRYHAGAIAPNTPVDGARYDARTPLETTVEREIVRPSGDGTASPARPMPRGPASAWNTPSRLPRASATASASSRRRSTTRDGSTGTTSTRMLRSR